MTPEERVEKCFKVKTLDGGTIDWSETEPIALPTNVRTRLAAAIREAVAEEREACAKIADHVSAECRKDSDLCGHGAAGEVAQLIRARA